MITKDRKKRTRPKLRVYKFSFLRRRNIAWFLLIVFVALQVFSAVQATTSGSNYSALEREEEVLNRENGELSSELVRLTSLKEVEGKADELGFLKPENIVYLNTEDFVAKIVKY